MAEHPPLTGSNSESDVAHLARMFATWQLLSIACSVWLFYIARHLKAGIPRLVACLPLAVGLLNAAPLMLDRCRMPVLFVPQMTLLSIAAFKVSVGVLQSAEAPLLQDQLILQLPSSLGMASIQVHRWYHRPCCAAYGRQSQAGRLCHCPRPSAAAHKAVQCCHRGGPGAQAERPMPAPCCSQSRASHDVCGVMPVQWLPVLFIEGSWPSAIYCPAA